MVNFVYLIGDRQTGECVVVDPAYGVRDLAMIAAEDGMNLTGALITHYHPDHCGGSMMGMRIEGVTELLELDPDAGARPGRRGRVGHEGHRPDRGGPDHARRRATP